MTKKKQSQIDTKIYCVEFGIHVFLLFYRNLPFLARLVCFEFRMNSFATNKKLFEKLHLKKQKKNTDIFTRFVTKKNGYSYTTHSNVWNLFLIAVMRLWFAFNAQNKYTHIHVLYMQSVPKDFFCVEEKKREKLVEFYTLKNVL